jgi:diaminopimelate epimerase
VVLTDGGDKYVKVKKIDSRLFYVNINMGQPSNYEKLLKLSEDHQGAKYLKEVSIYFCSIGNSHIMIYLTE